MGTRSSIGIENKDGSVRTIFCHYDGYPSYTGKRLLQTFYNREFAEALVSEGNRTCIYNDDEVKRENNLYGEPSNLFDTTDQWITVIDGAFIDYCYLFKQDGLWYFTSRVDKNQFVVLTEQCCLPENKKYN
jgi:hypothetical protein